MQVKTNYQNYQDNAKIAHENMNVSDSIHVFHGRRAIQARDF
jgi:hypothetical protein